jgi:hypothetical protein
MSAITVDSLPVAQLPTRYSISRSVLYNRLSDLKIETEKRGNKAYVNADQLRLLDDAHNAIQQGISMAEFLVSRGLSDKHTEPSNGQSGRQSDGQLTAVEYPALVATLMHAIAALPSTQPDPLANLELLEKACSRGWLLSTSQLAPLLGVKSLTGKEIHRYGFTFTRVGRNGTESAWAIAKTARES